MVILCRVAAIGSVDQVCENQETTVHSITCARRMYDVSLLQNIPSEAGHEDMAELHGNNGSGIAFRHLIADTAASTLWLVTGVLTMSKVF